MVSRRQQDAYIEQPVRFYKFIALTFLLLTIVLLGMVVFMSSKRATITITTKATPIDVNADVTVGTEGTAHTVSGIVKRIDVSGEQAFSPEGTKQVPSQATGVVTLINDSSRPQPLVATTRLLNDDGVLFRLESGVTVPANGSIDNIVVYSDTEGIENNIPASDFTIPGLNATRQQEIYAKSDAPMTGGVREVGIIDASDIDTAREQLKVELLAQGDGAFAEQYPDMGVVYGITNLETNGTDFVGEELSTFTLRGTAQLVAVLYDEDAMQDWADRQLMKQAIGDTEFIRSGSTNPTVTFGEFNTEDETARLNVFYAGVVTLNPESKQIEKPVFFGKDRDEVRRYLLSLDRVHGVDVQLRPAWMRAVPHIHDHVSVVVKEIE